IWDASQVGLDRLAAKASELDGLSMTHAGCFAAGVRRLRRSRSLTARPARNKKVAKRSRPFLTPVHMDLKPHSLPTARSNAHHADEQAASRIPARRHERGLGDARGLSVRHPAEDSRQ